MKEKLDFRMSSVQFMKYLLSKPRTRAQIIHRIKYYRKVNGYAE